MLNADVGNIGKLVNLCRSYAVDLSVLRLVVLMECCNRSMVSNHANSWNSGSKHKKTTVRKSSPDD